MAYVNAKLTPDEADYLRRLNQSYVPHDSDFDDKIHHGAEVYDASNDGVERISQEELDRRQRNLNRRKDFGKLKWGLRGAALGARLMGQKDVANTLSSTAMDARAIQKGSRVREDLSYLSGKYAAKAAKHGVTIKNKQYKASGGKAAIIGGAVKGLVKGGGLKTIGISIINTYIFYIAFGFLWTPWFPIALLYLDFHWVMTYILPDVFLPLWYRKKIMVIGANLLAITVITLTLTLMGSMLYAVCSGGTAGYAVRAIYLLMGNVGGAFHTPEICEGFTEFVDNNISPGTNGTVSGQILYDPDRNCIINEKPRGNVACVK